MGFVLNVADLSPIKTPIFAIAHFSLGQVLHDWLHNQMFDPSQTSGGGQTLLEIAAKRDCLSFCADLVARGACDDGSALSTAAFSGHLDVVKYLVEEAHADVNLLLEVGNYGSALAAAAGCGRLDVMKYLVEEAHADVNLLLKVGEYSSALAAAAAWGNRDVVKYLVEEAYADVNLLLRVGEYGSALAAAAAEGELEVLKDLVEEARAEVDLLPLDAAEYGSPLAFAVEKGHMRIVRYLVELGKADVNLSFGIGSFTVHWKWHWPDMINLLPSIWLAWGQFASRIASEHR